MNQNRKYTLKVLAIVRDNPHYHNRMREAQKQVALLIADHVTQGWAVGEHLFYAYNYFKERA